MWASAGICPGASRISVRIKITRRGKARCSIHDGVQAAPYRCQQSKCLFLRVLSCRRNCVTHLKELGAVDLDNAGCEHDSGKLVGDTISVQTKSARPAAICVRAQQHNDALFLGTSWLGPESQMSLRATGLRIMLQMCDTAPQVSNAQHVVDIVAIRHTSVCTMCSQRLAKIAQVDVGSPKVEAPAPRRWGYGPGQPISSPPGGLSSGPSRQVAEKGPLLMTLP